MPPHGERDRGLLADGDVMTFEVDASPQHRNAVSEQGNRPVASWACQLLIQPRTETNAVRCLVRRTTCRRKPHMAGRHVACGTQIPRRTKHPLCGKQCALDIPRNVIRLLVLPEKSSDRLGKSLEHVLTLGPRRDSLAHSNELKKRQCERNVVPRHVRSPLDDG